MACLAEIDAGSAEAQRELLFLFKLIELVQLPGSIEPQPKVSGALGFSDVYRCSACRADDFIRINKASEGLLKSLAALRVMALENVGRVVEMARHGGSVSRPGSSCANARNALPAP